MPPNPLRELLEVVEEIHMHGILDHAKQILQSTLRLLVRGIAEGHQLSSISPPACLALRNKIAKLRNGLVRQNERAIVVIRTHFYTTNVHVSLLCIFSCKRADFFNKPRLQQDVTQFVRMVAKQSKRVNLPSILIR